VLPCTHIRIRVTAPTPARRAAIDAVFGNGSGFRDAVLRRLRDRRASTPDGFDVSLKVSGKTAPDAPPVQIDYLRRPEKAAASPIAAMRAHIVVTRGTAARKVYVCTGRRINIGRVEDVLGADHHVLRRNHITFEGAQDAANETVSRSHAHILFTPSTGEFRVFDDRSSYGTRIFRDGRTIDVPSARGALLRSGDEISFGRAAVRFAIKKDV
jgi:hypothetical protein